MPITTSSRVPHVQQMSVADCGAACLTMIVQYHGLSVSLDECRQVVGGGRQGVSAKALLDAARTFGLRGMAYSVEPHDLIVLTDPAILHWGFNHFVVLESVEEDGLRIVDPSGGPRLVDWDEAASSFTGVVLALEPGEHFGKRAPEADDETREAGASAASTGQSRGRRTSLWQVLRRLTLRGDVRGSLLQILGASLLLQVLGLALPVLTKVVVDGVLPYSLHNVMSGIGIGMVLVIVVFGTTALLRVGLLVYLQGRVDSQLMVGFIEHLLRLPYTYFEEHGSGDLMDRLNSNMSLREILTSQTTSVLLDGMFVLVYLVLLFLLSPLFASVVLVLALVKVGILLAVTSKTHALMQKDLATHAESANYSIEFLKGIQYVKASGTENAVLERWMRLFYRNLNAVLERNQFTSSIESIIRTLQMAAPMIVLWVGALLVLDGTMTLGTMLALSALAAAFFQPIVSLVSSGQRLQLVGAHFERIQHVLNAQTERLPTTDAADVSLDGVVEVRNLSFRYDEETPWVLEDVSFRIEPGQKLAIVGPSGSGKSTLVSLLLGLYAPQRGTISYDGTPLTELPLHALRQQIGVVLQDAHLFSGSIRENVQFGTPDATLDDVEAATETAGIRAEIEAMPMKYETILAEGGAGLSGGQRQRLALARALMRTPHVLFLDEATSHLDTETESRVERNLSALDCTRLVIAHRLSTIRDADEILVLDDGRLVESGTHEDLVDKNGHYARLVRSQ